MSADRRTIIFWISLITLALLILLAPRGCSTVKGNAEFDLKGNLSINLTADQSIQPNLQKRIRSELFLQDFIRKDWAFVTFYECNVEVDLTPFPVQQKAPIFLAVKVPGKITSSNAQRIEGNTAIWGLNPGHGYNLKLTSRHIRWWLIVLVALSIISLISSWFALGRSLK
ncbi:MAG: hypothetical protein QMD66_03415 [Actinomycetota bacterium]|nr:hypothetical protein [Actinomycetota bacterium]